MYQLSRQSNALCNRGWRHNGDLSAKSPMYQNVLFMEDNVCDTTQRRLAEARCRSQRAKNRSRCGCRSPTTLLSRTKLGATAQSPIEARELHSGQPCWSHSFGDVDLRCRGNRFDQTRERFRFVSCQQPRDSILFARVPGDTFPTPLTPLGLEFQPNH